jgi:transposase
MPPRLSAQQREDIERMLRNGSHFNAIAYECDVDPHTVGRMAKAIGISPPKGHRQPSTRTQQAVDMVLNGMTLSRACHLTGARSDQVREALARRGITYLPKAS